MRLLERARRALRADEVVVDARLRAILTHQIHCKVNVVVALLRHTVADSDPAARRLRTFVVVEAHRPHEVVSDRAPLVIGQQPFLRTKRERAMPHVTARNIDVKDG
nr:hypothetical protein [Paraoerskovia sediminicola]